ncbi:MAG: HAD-IG family 5'-nucleotidase [bacterium]|nr:HAD-IG family 5'-nucleotidase [bacterium]MCP4799749.1 HAD-IG family 5'-nucleotidase [bacterium]
MNSIINLQPKTLPVHQRVWTNRNLRMATIDAVGFDMDHTLALYNSATFEQLCFEMAIDNLITVKGYPEEIRSISYDRKAVARGLIIDKRHGNIIKVDTHGYVARVRHGGKLLSREERRKYYKRGRIRLSPKRYRVVDTLFDLPEGSLYTELVTLKDNQPKLLKVSFRVLFDDIRNSIDTIHRDGSLKRKIVAEIPKYFKRDDLLSKTLDKFRNAGKKLFLLTNSDYSYTCAVMDFILSSKAKNWEEYFDLVICSAQKPGFFLQSGKGTKISGSKCNCFSGGDAFFLESKIGSLGDQILYFGDHTYGDILRSKKSAGWRTAMIVPEVETEVLDAEPVSRSIRALEETQAMIEELSLEKDHLLEIGEDTVEIQQQIESSLSRRAILRKRIASIYNPYWGSIFREGRVPSRFGGQIRDVACIYTSRVSNLSHYSAHKFFASVVEQMPHE